MLSPNHKRQASRSAESAPEKRQELSASAVSQSSLFEQAEQHRLVTARFSIHVLTPEWKYGSNRVPNVSHVRQLCRSFESGLHRTDLNNTLRLACSQAEVDRMISELKRQGDNRADWKQRVPDAWPSFWGWEHVNPEPVELMAGHHRVEAMKEYLKDRKDAEDEGWWLCDVYNQDTLPLELSIRLRANREELSLPDTHGQIWNELCVLAQRDAHWYRSSESAGPGKHVPKVTAKCMERQLTLKLGLSSKPSFPVRRLGTLWRNEPWRQMITEWCQFPLGRALFNITTLEWMSSCRIDEFWFSTLREAVRTLRVLRDKHSVEVQSSDWARLSQLPATRPCLDVQRVFFPRLQHEEGDVSELRVKGFLTELSDLDYDRVYDLVLSDTSLRFPDVHGLLKTSPREGKIMRTIMTHVGQWLNRDAFRPSNRADEKPPLWKDLLPAVQSHHPQNAADHCLELQRQVLVFVHTRLADFLHTSVEPLLEIYPDNAIETYPERFEHGVWHDLLKLMHDFCGPSFQHDALKQFNETRPSTPARQATSTIVPSMCHALESLPEIVQNPALRGKQAIKDLQTALQPVVFRWAVEKCQRIVDAGGDSEGGPTRIVVQEDLDRYRRLLSATEPPAERLVPPSTTEVVTTSVETPPLNEAPSQPSTQPSTKEASSGRGRHHSRSPTADMTRPIKPQLVPKSQPRKSEKALDSSQGLFGIPRSSRPRHQDVHRDLDDILQLPPQPFRAKLSRTGRGWRFQPGVHARSNGSK